MENEIFSHDLFTGVLEATVIQLIAKCFQSLWLAFKYIYMYIYVHTHIYIHTHIHVWKRCAMNSPKEKKKLKSNVVFFIFLYCLR